MCISFVSSEIYDDCNIYGICEDFITTSGNITYSSNITNLSQLSDTTITSPADGEVLTWSSALMSWINSAAGSGVKWLFGSSPYWFNDSTTVYFNETQLNVTIDARASGLGDNSSWNESLANTLYAPIGSSGGNASWNESYANTLYADISVVTDNATWSESRADTLYAAIGSGGGGSSPWQFTVDYIFNLTAKLGIGTSTPSHELTVVGDMNITGNIYNGGKQTFSVLSGTLPISNTFSSAAGFDCGYTNCYTIFQNGTNESMLYSRSMDDDYNYESLTARLSFWINASSGTYVNWSVEVMAQNVSTFTVDQEFDTQNIGGSMITADDTTLHIVEIPLTNDDDLNPSDDITYKVLRLGTLDDSNDYAYLKSFEIVW